AGLPDGATGLLIDGRWRSSGIGLDVADKYTLQPFATIQQARPSDVAAAVAGAVAAAERPLPPAQRHDILGEASRLLAARRDDAREVYVAETGFTPADAATEITRAIGTMRLSAQEALGSPARRSRWQPPPAARAGWRSRSGCRSAWWRPSRRSTPR